MTRPFKISSARGGATLTLELPEGQAARGYFAGSLESLPLPQVFDHIITGIRTGKLILDTELQHKTVSFRDGQVSFASSTQPHERLGPLLVRRGMLSRDEVEAAVQQIGPGARLGQVLTRTGRLTAARLYRALCLLVQEIVLDLFELSTGQFVFLEGAADEDAVKLTERTRELVLEGIKRGDEVMRLRKSLPLTARVTCRPGPRSGEHAELLTRVERTAPLAVLRGGFDGSDYGFLSWVDGLLRSGELIVQPEALLPEQRPSPLLKSPQDLYRELIDTLCQTLRESGHGLSGLQSFFDELPPGLDKAFAGVRLTAEGKLDIDAVVANSTAKGGARNRAKAYEALDAFVSFGFFSARNVLAPQVAESLRRKLILIREGS